MIDFKRVDGDISFNGYDFETIDADNDNLIQKLVLRIKRYYGEWFKDTRKGVDYFGYFFKKDYDPVIIEALLKAEILEEEDVEQVTSLTFSIDNNTRISTIVFSVTATSGESTGIVEVSI